MGEYMLIDGNSILNRAFYGIRLLTTASGLYTNALYGALNIILKQLDEEKPGGLCVCFDRREPTFRHKAYAGYKATRKGMPEELAQQLPEFKELLAAMNIETRELSGFEADDLLGTYSRQLADAGDDCVILTGDRDSFQLIGDGVSVKYVSTKAGQSDAQLYDSLKINIDYGVEPRQLIDVKSLMGDASDNIPGVPGVGEKTALALIARFGSLDGVYANLSDESIKPAARAKLEAGRDSAYMSRMLAEIDRHVPTELAAADIARKPFDNDKLYDLLFKYELRTLITRLKLKPTATRFAPAAPETEGEAFTFSVPSRAAELTAVSEFLAGAEEPLGACFQGEVFALSDGKKSIETDISELTAQQAEEYFELVSARALAVHGSKELYGYCLAHKLRLPKIEFDTLLAAYLLNMPQSLDDAAERYLHVRLGEEQQSLFGGADTAKRADAVLALRGLFGGMLSEQKLQKLYYEVELPLAEVIADMEDRGFRVNRGELESFGAELDEKLLELESRIYELAGESFNINSPRQLGQILFEKLGLPSGRKTKTGYSTDADTLKHLAPFAPIVAAILEYRTYAKLRSTYVDGLDKEIAPDGRIHCTLNQTGTVTGRLSSSEPNLQNIPVRSEPGSRLRDMFEAESGCLLADADYSQIELRVLAHVADDEAMIKAFADGEDIHRITASKVYGIPPEEVTSAQRARTKAVNFGIVYGISDFSLADDIGSTRGEAREMIDSYLEHYSGVKRYMSDITAFAREHGYVTTLDGRRRYLPDIKASNFNLRSAAERTALNTPIQGTAADIIKRAMVMVYRRLKNEAPSAHLIMQIHDELIAECPAEEAEKVLSLLKEEMESAAALKVKITADGGTGRTWGEAHS